jgi:hypothetical protein
VHLQSRSSSTCGARALAEQEPQQQQQQQQQPSVFELFLATFFLFFSMTSQNHRKCPAFLNYFSCFFSLVFFYDVSKPPQMWRLRRVCRSELGVSFADSAAC